jgi:hypothetical protein
MDRQVTATEKAAPFKLTSQRREVRRGRCVDLKANQIPIASGGKPDQAVGARTLHETGRSDRR